MINIYSISSYLRQQFLIGFRTDKNHDLLDSLGAPNQTTLDSLKALDDDAVYKIGIGFETVSLAHYLNDKYDKYDRRIQILTNEDRDATYLFLEAENRILDFDYNGWMSSTSHIAGDRVERLGKIYEAQSNNSDKAPEAWPTVWFLEEDAGYISTEEGYGAEYDFSIMIPDTYDDAETYNKGALVLHENAVWIASENSITGAWNEAKWNNYNNALRSDFNRYVSVGRKYNIKDLY